MQIMVLVFFHFSNFYSMKFSVYKRFVNGSKYSRMDQKNCGRQPLKNFTLSIFECFDSNETVVSSGI